MAATSFVSGLEGLHIYNISVCGMAYCFDNVLHKLCQPYMQLLAFYVTQTR